MRHLIGALVALAALCAFSTPALAQTAQPLSSCGGESYTANGLPMPLTQTGTGLLCTNSTATTTPAATTPAAGTAHAIVTGGVAVRFVTGPVKGCYITNPLSATDEGIATVEPLYVNAVTTATTLATDGSSVALQPGQTFNCVPGQTTHVSANALTSSHNAVVVAW